MKKKYFFGLFALALSSLGNAQTFTDNFDTYNVGDFLGVASPTWTTWSNAPGTTEDVTITNNDAFSGTNSIYLLASSSNGGPQDVVLPFGAEYNTGQFDFSAYFKVDANKGAYFNFQSNATIGQVWALDVQMVDNGDLVLSNGDGTFLTTTYPTNTWFKLSLNIDLTTNNWELLIDNVSQGSFANTQNQIASIDIFPVNSSNGGNGQAGFYIDDVVYNYVPYALTNRNGAPINITGITGVVGVDRQPTVTVRNLGTTAITSFDLTIDYNGSQIVENITGVNIPSLGTYDVAFTNPITLVAGSNSVIATISNVNGMATDDVSSDDIKTVTINPVVPATGKVVLAEEGTGTWCQWCPRGAVMMDRMSANYPQFFAGVAVHNGDPMTYAPYDQGMGFSSFPNSKTDRGSATDPSNIEAEFLQRITVAPSALLTNGAVIDGNILKVSVSAEFVTSISGDYRLACVITEDSVTGTSSGYNQANAYAGGSSGVMGGYELLPSTVPASQMVYDHVGRVILPDVNGQPNSFPASVNTGETHVVDFYFNIDPDWDMSKINIISMLIAPNGDIDNAGKATKDEAIANGFIQSTVEVVAVEELNTFSKFDVYPNPTNGFTYVYLDNSEAKNVSMSIYDLNGKLIVNKEYGMINNSVKLPINTSAFNKGVYIIKLNVDGTVQTKKLVVE